MPKNVDHKGRRQEPPHVRLYHSMMETEAWGALSLGGRCLLLEICRRWNGRNNGDLFLSIREAADLLGVHRNTAMKLFHELDEKGFTRVTTLGHFKVKTKAATCRRLTWVRWNDRPPTRDFADWKRPGGNKSRAQSRSTTGTTDVPVTGNTDDLGTTDVPERTETSQFPRPPICTPDVPLVVSQQAGADEPDLDRRKHAGNSGGRFRDLLNDEATDQLRERLNDYLATAPVGAQTRLSEASRIPAGTLSKFKEGRGLPPAHFVSLQLTLNSTAIERTAA